MNVMKSVCVWGGGLTNRLLHLVFTFDENEEFSEDFRQKMGGREGRPPALPFLHLCGRALFKLKGSFSALRSPLKRSEGLLKCSEGPFKRAEGLLNAQRALSSAKRLFHHTDAQNEICFVGLG